MPSSGHFQQSSILHIPDSQRVCSVSLTTDSANLYSLLQEYHRIFLSGFWAVILSARRAYQDTSLTWSSRSNCGFLHKSFQLLIQHKAPHLHFEFFNDPTTQFGCTIYGPNTHSTGCLFFSLSRRRLGFVFYLLYIPTQARASLSVGLPVCLFVCLSAHVCCFVSLFFTVQRPRLGVVIYSSEASF